VLHPLAGLALLLATPAAASENWAAAWMAAPFPAIPKLVARDERSFEQVTVRQFVRLSLDGRRIRLRLTNELGTAPVRFAEVRVALLDGAGRMRTDTDRRVDFVSNAIPAGGPLLSEPVGLPVRAGERMVISVFYDRVATPAAHLLEVQLSARGDHAAAAVLPEVRTVRAPALASAVEVSREGEKPVIVAFGDSITEGFGSTEGGFKGWPEQFADRLRAAPATRGWSVINAGINGNRLLRNGAGANGLARFDRDALSVAGVTHVIVLEGINDIGWGSQPDPAQEPVSAEDVIGAYRQMIGRAHARGIRICGGTLLSYGGAQYWTAKGEAKRQAVNRWIRASGAFDCVIEFERALADPSDPGQIAPDLHSGDHLHPDDAGYAAMAAAIDPALVAP
jgi:lysophospholipase L1-like esterase